MHIKNIIKTSCEGLSGLDRPKQTAADLGSENPPNFQILPVRANGHSGYELLSLSACIIYEKRGAVTPSLLQLCRINLCLFARISSFPPPFFIITLIMSSNLGLMFVFHHELCSICFFAVKKDVLYSVIDLLK